MLKSRILQPPKRSLLLRARFIYSLTHSLTHSPTHLLSHSLDYYDNTLFYRASNSDGTGGQGIRPDCGFIDTYPSTCYVEGKSICNGNGYCSNSTSLCTCHDGSYGLTCAVRECPKGYAWFDEATSSVDAHSLVECSNMGTCDRATGICKCRDGFTGSACDVYDCPRDSDGSPCSGHGTHSLTHSLTHSRAYSLTYLLLTNVLTHSHLTHSLKVGV